jgi:hypothetical protein
MFKSFAYTCGFVLKSRKQWIVYDYIVRRTCYFCKKLIALVSQFGQGILVKFQTRMMSLVSNSVGRHTTDMYISKKLYIKMKSHIF